MEAKQVEAKQEYVSTTHVSTIFGVRPHVVLGWIRKGVIAAIKPGIRGRRGGRYLIPIEEVERLKAGA